ncbi:hypothetical protein LTR91_020382 [Friedmanniomyces endolithicus]|uniref:Methylcrotonoyl-CoA carboxylase subunit alpha, mitochondrial n=1 Tax=Friedmanniomyces endolithicus TaxID=329885 RepID=A0AAN6K169_9PEZI|nr:hypothetical protein LTR94_016332 [Friedmanniomyces endolithicus]KAK0777256.1 hypothetical protein LTR59_013906 [Friedmanniomyces endolithicus]KAK0782178.1 hypothetical protein LTR38_013474 [Friedmanniomyces endolithicus]KAK0786603.1 hypothetical protein LTR75_013133 [Friedmanniomyces endolithicus]KAK0836435.1 hypothetical protein LTR03_013681 [Friedmanniomyces endolithicus]
MRSLARTKHPLLPAIPTSTLTRTPRWNSTTTPTTPTHTPLHSILIANRGEIALRVARTASAQGIRTTTLYTDPDFRSQHALSSPFALNLGSTDQYLNGARIISLAQEHKCEAIHPGYGFLSENAGFARSCEEAGVKFIGPPWKAIEAMGDKARSKEIMSKAGVPCIPGYHGGNQDPAYLAQQAEEIGYPVLLKAVKGGGGKGMRIVDHPSEFTQQLASAKSEARSSFADDIMLVEKYILTPRHIEVQIFADAYGNCLALGERDCSIQRRHQKILEESPAPNLAEEIRQDLWEKARQAALAVGYQGAGTVEFIFDNETGDFFFMEMNTRLQVEHPVTEMVTGLDLVAWQFLVAEGRPLPLTQSEVTARIAARGHAIEARIYAEDPSRDFAPSTGTLVHLRTPPVSETVRIDAGFVQGDEVSAFYDPMIAKLIVSAPTRAQALGKMGAALDGYEVVGPVTNIEFLKRVCASPAFGRGEVETGYIAKFKEELFGKREVEEGVWVQGAIGLWEAELSGRTGGGSVGLVSRLGFGGEAMIPQAREFRLAEVISDPLEPTPAPTLVRLLKTGPQTYSVSVGDQGESYTVTSSYNPSTHSLRTFFPTTRLDSTVILTHPTTPTPTPTTELHLFTHGSHTHLSLLPPPWVSKTLSTTQDSSNTVLAPMPCKILRVEVEVGDVVTKGQVLVVVESMKMEMSVRSPREGVRVKRVVRGVGEVCGVGGVLVEFEEVDGGTVGGER